MTDPTSAALHALATRNSWTPALAFAAGIASSFSPCVAPRMLAVAGLTANKPVRSALWVVAVFIAGVVAAYSLFVVGGAVVWRSVGFSGYLFAGIAAAMAVLGIVTLTRHAECGIASLPHSNKGVSSVFLLGAASAATFSPCCMPVIAAAVLYAPSTGPGFAWLMVVCFALGHAAPLTLTALGARVVGLAVHSGVQSAARVVAGALMLAVAGFYCVLA